MASFRTWLLELAPPWLRQAYGEAWLRAVADPKDELLARAKAAVLARFAALAPSDALDLLGVERQLPRGPDETDAAYAQRLASAWEAWPWAGTAFGLLSAMRDIGYPGLAIIIAKGKRYTLDGSQTLVVTDLSYAGTAPVHWSSFFLHFPASAYPASWSGTPPAQDSDEGELIISRVKKWKAAHARLNRIVLGGTAIWGIPIWGTPPAAGTFSWGTDLPVVWEL